MTREDDIFQLAAAIKLSGPSDGVLVPLYSLYPSNKYFVAVTDTKMRIQLFHEIDSFFEYIVHTDVTECTKLQYVSGDLAPVAFSAADNVEIVWSETVEDLIGCLKSYDQGNFPLVQEIVRDLLAAFSAEDRARQHDAAYIPQLDAGDIRPQATRLWLDIAVEDLFAGNPRKLDADAQKAKIRLQLLSWAMEIPKVATTPIFRHFISTARRAEINGVYVEDIVATAIVNWVAEEIARLDKVVDLVRDFRSTYGRSPLASVRALLDHGVDNLSRWASEALTRYYDYVRRVLASPSTYRLLVVTFVADGGDHWPEDIGSRLEAERAEQERRLKSLLDEMAKTAKRLKRGARVADAGSRLLALARSVQATTARLDAMQKVLSSGDVYGDPIQRFRAIDYAALGLNQDYFIKLDRELSLDDMIYS